MMRRLVGAGSLY